MSKNTTVKCPTCNKLIVWDNDHPYRPFCCERCKLIDLGAWADESYKVASDEKPIDPDEENS